MRERAPCPVSAGQTRHDLTLHLKTSYMLLRDDNALWGRFQDGDAEALKAIFLDHYDPLFRYGLKLTHDEELVKDCLQELFYKLWKNRQHLDGVQMIRPYLYKACRRILTDALASRNRKQKALARQYPLDTGIIFSREDFLIEQQHLQEQRHKLLHALNQLPARQREAIYLRFFGGMDYEKVAQVMDINTQSVRNLVYQACKNLKEQLVLLKLLFLLLHAAPPLQ